MDSRTQYSHGWDPVRTEEIPVPVAEAIETVRGLPQVAGLASCVRWPVSGWPTALATIRVELPSRGPVDGLDIRPEEPVMFAFPPEFPHGCPRAFPDRTDFPVSSLPHLYAAPSGAPSCLCLNRGSGADWYARNGIVQFVSRTQRWFSDAAAGRLMPADDGFEPIRIADGARWGISMVDPARVAGTCGTRYISRRDGRAWAYVGALLWQRVADGDVLSLLSLRSEISDTAATHIAGLVPRRDLSAMPVVAVMAWTKGVRRTYSIPLPQTLDELLRLLSDECGISNPASVLAIARSPFGLPLPVYLVVRRPQRVLGNPTYEDTVTFMSFGGHTGAKVVPLLTEAPYNTSVARRVSGVLTPPVQGLVVVGAGAVGSKVALHLARAGCERFHIVDPDIIHPHNMARHALLPDSLQLPKAVMLCRAINAMSLPADERAVPVPVTVAEADRRGLLPQDADVVIDCSASDSVSGFLAENSQSFPARRISCFIAHGGSIGATLIEGDDHSPSIEDLEGWMWDAAIEDASLSEWLRGRLQREEDNQDPDLDEVELGGGCSTVTMRCPDDAISAHSALMGICIREHGLISERRAGVVQRTVLSPGAGLKTVVDEVQPPTLLAAEADARWQIRVCAAATTRIEQLSADRLPNETGGLLLGYVDVSRQLIHVTRAEPAPPDSLERPYAFTRGIEDLPQRVLDIHGLTGGLIGYVGEWHSHGNGAPTASVTDEATLSLQHKVLRRTGRPAFILILGHGQYRAYLK